jgi:hypothetical protein
MTLYRGALVNLIAGSVAQSIFFYAYADGKTRYNFDKENPNSFVTAWISLRAGMISTAITTPLWVLKTRLALYRKSHGQQGYIIQNLLREMMFKEGPRSFYQGFVPSMFLSCYGMIQMYSYENINHFLGFHSG